MQQIQPLPELFKLMAHDLRWGLLSALSTGDHRVNELVTLVEQPTNLVSYHLKLLRDAGVVSTRRSEADGRDIYYSLDLQRLSSLYAEAGRALHPALVAADTPSPDPEVLRVLFVCTHNSARSQMAEALMRQAGGGAVQVSSAGSHPAEVHPNALITLQNMGVDASGQRSKGFEDVSGESFDYVITVCDRAREVCPVFPGNGKQLHWGYPDPAVIEDDAARAKQFAFVAAALQTRIHYFLESARHKRAS